MALFSRRDYAGAKAEDLIPQRGPARQTGSVAVNNDSALRHSAVWACLRLRANLVSTLPCDVYRRIEGIQVELPKPPVLVEPGGERVDYLEWMYATQFDLDRAGNAFGIISQRAGTGLPSRIDLVPLSDVTVRVRKGELWRYKIGAQEYEPRDIWHERQYTLAGLHVGLSPVAYAAWSIGEYLSIQEFALDWFGNGAIPAATLKNTDQVVSSDQASTIKARYKASVSAGDVFVHGKDWDFKPIQAESAGADWIEAKQFGISDIARFFDVPGDLIDAAVSGSSVTYANIVQRNLQFLIMNLGPAIIRRENALSKLLAKPRYVKLKTDALLRMDAKARAELLKLRIDARSLAPSEWRELENEPPFTEAQISEFDRLFGAPRTNPSPAPNPGATP